MECKMVESSACREWQSLIVRLCGRITHRASLSVSPQSDKRLTQDEFSKALHLTEHTLQYYRQTDIVPHTAIGNNIFFQETDIHRILTDNLIPARRYRTLTEEQGKHRMALFPFEDAAIAEQVPPVIVLVFGFGNRTFSRVLCHRVLVTDS